MVKNIQRKKMTENFKDNKTIQAQSSESISGGGSGIVMIRYKIQQVKNYGINN